MDDKKRCPICDGAFKVEHSQINSLLNEMIDSGNFNIVDKETYNLRLKNCFNCSELLDKCTCKQCGCFVQIRAAVVENNCPYPNDKKW